MIFLPLGALFAFIAGYSFEPASYLLFAAFVALVAAAAAMGLYGVITGMVLLIWYTAGLESFGKAYTAPFTGSDAGALARVLLKRPNRANKFRSRHLAGWNRRRQGKPWSRGSAFPDL